MEIHIMLLCSAVLFLAGVVRGLTAFGLSLVGVPLLSIIYSPRLVVPLMNVYGILACIYLLYPTWRWIDFKAMIPLVAASLVGIPLGAHILASVSIPTLKILIGFSVVLLSFVLLCGMSFRVSNGGGVALFAGFLSGLLVGSMSLPGPPVTLYMISQRWRKNVMRGTLTAYFLIVYLLTAGVYRAYDLLTYEVLDISIKLFPGLLLGLYVGDRLSHGVERHTFRKIVILLLIIVGLANIYKGII